MDFYPKYIIEDGNLILSKCTYHKNLVTDAEKVQGGGWFRYNHDEKTFTFYDDSHEYGRASLEDVQKAVDEYKVYANKRIRRSIAINFKFVYDTGSELIELN